LTPTSLELNIAVVELAGLGDAQGIAATGMDLYLGISD
jgi:hypothetical protein